MRYGFKGSQSWHVLDLLLFLHGVHWHFFAPFCKLRTLLRQVRFDGRLTKEVQLVQSSLPAWLGVTLIDSLYFCAIITEDFSLVFELRFGNLFLSTRTPQMPQTIKNIPINMSFILSISAIPKGVIFHPKWSLINDTKTFGHWKRSAQSSWIFLNVSWYLSNSGSELEIWLRPDLLNKKIHTKI